MYFIKLNILLSVLICISVNLVSATVPDICMRTLDLESKNLSKKESAKMTNCIINEMIKRGVKPCDSKCLKKLTPEQSKQYFERIGKETQKIIDEERARRGNEALSVKDNCLETIQLNPGEGMTYEDTANFVSCIMHELEKRGLKECKDECYEKLSKSEKEKYDDQFLATFGEILQGESTRRALQSSLSRTSKSLGF